jgi:hypothetical protein
MKSIIEAAPACTVLFFQVIGGSEQCLLGGLAMVYQMFQQLPLLFTDDLSMVVESCPDSEKEFSFCYNRRS